LELVGLRLGLGLGLGPHGLQLELRRSDQLVVDAGLPRDLDGLAQLGGVGLVHAWLG
tara:strand:+ start:241 stop:411 length:171 start_codon:yes stop_codon:yes gene_type:complete